MTLLHCAATLIWLERNVNGPWKSLSPQGQAVYCAMVSFRFAIKSANAFCGSSASLTTLVRALLNSVTHSTQPTHSQGEELLRESMQTAALSSGRKRASVVNSFKLGRSPAFSCQMVCASLLVPKATHFQAVSA